MNVSQLARIVLPLVAGAALAAGCAGPSNSYGAAAPAPLTPGLKPHAGHAPSWMSPEAKTSQSLLYVADNWTGDVYVFRYPKIKLVGTLSGFYDLEGICTDPKGNVWIPELDDVLEYAHGGTTAISTLADDNEFAYDCSVDPTTGNLAVANYSTTGSGAGNVLIFPDAQGTPQTYTDTDMYYYDSLSYDDRGNLFVDGTQAQSGGFGFAQLPSGGSSFTNYALDLSYAWPGGVAWDGQYITVEDANAETVYQVTVSGSSVTIVGSTTLDGLRGITQYSVPVRHRKKPHQGTELIAGGSESADVGVYAYPGGGSPVETIGSYGNPFVAPVGAVVSFK